MKITFTAPQMKEHGDTTPIIYAGPDVPMVNIRSAIRDEEYWELESNYSGPLIIDVEDKAWNQRRREEVRKLLPNAFLYSYIFENGKFPAMYYGHCIPVNASDPAEWLGLNISKAPKRKPWFVMLQIRVKGPGGQLKGLIGEERLIELRDWFNKLGVPKVGLWSDDWTGGRKNPALLLEVAAAGGDPEEYASICEYNVATMLRIREVMSQ